MTRTRHIPSTQDTSADPHRDDPSARGVTDAVHDILRRSGAPGASVAVVGSGGLLLSAGYGLADVARSRAATSGTAYLWFSMTKVVTATAAMRLADDGRLDLDAPVRAHLADLPVPRGRDVSTRQLLTHTAGLSNPFPIRWVHAADRPAPSSRDLLVRLLRRRGAFRTAPGGRARYTNVGYLLLGEVISAVAGMPLEAYVQQAVLDPAGMRRTGYAYRSDQDAATGYVRAPRVLDPVLDRMLRTGVAGGRYGHLRALRPFYVDGPAYGGLVGDVQDAARFLRLHLGDGELDGRRVLSAGAAREMRRISHAGRPFDHGIGWFRKPATGAGDRVEHFGAGAGFWNAMRLYPERDRGVVVMANTTAAYDIDALCQAAVHLT